MHVDGDGGGSRIAEVVFHRVRDGEGTGLPAGLVAHGIAGDKHQPLERMLVDLKIVLQLHRSAIGVCDMVEHVHGHDAAGTHLGGDIARLRHGIRACQRRRLQGDHTG